MSAKTDMLIVYAGGQCFALPAAEVRSVSPLGALTRVPGQPPDILGLANLRGEIVTVADLICRLTGGDIRAPDCQNLVAVSCQGQTCGFAVESVGDVAMLGPDDSVELPAQRASGRAHFSAGWRRFPGGLAEALDIEALCGFGTPGGGGV